MVVRGRLAFDDQGRLVEIAEDAAGPNNPEPSEIDPVEFEELIAQTAGIQNLDAGQLVSALDANGVDISNVDRFSASLVAIGNVAGLMYSTTDQSIPNATITKMQYDTAERDSSVASVDFANNQIDITEDGVYYLHGVTRWGADTAWATGDRIDLRINVNGSNVSVDELRKVSTAGQGVTNSVVKELSAGDTVSMDVYQNSGASQEISGSIPRNRLEVMRLG